MRAALKSGRLVTLARLRGYSLLLIGGYIIALVALLATADGIVDYAGRPLGTDFMNVYAAGKLADVGHAADAYDFTLHHAAQKIVAGRPDVPYFSWHYPPPFLMLAAALATMPYLLALLVYQAATLAAYLRVVRQIAGTSQAWLPALAFPAVFINLTHGHNGFITAALLGGALLLLERRPLLAGCLIGCLTYKPQFALLVPVVLAVSGRWRTFAAAAASALALLATTWLVFGSSVFAAFWDQLPLAQRMVLEGPAGFYKLQSVYAALRLAGLPLAAATAVQGFVTLVLALLLALLWRSAAAFELKAAALLIACPLATPYVFDYDLLVLAPAIAFLTAHGLARGFAPYEASALAALWLMPLVARSLAQATDIAIAPLVMLAALAIIAHRAGLAPSLRATFRDLVRRPRSAA
jgi:Glycosyltransferase family 87